MKSNTIYINHNYYRKQFISNFRNLNMIELIKTARRGSCEILKKQFVPYKMRLLRQ